MPTLLEALEEKYGFAQTSDIEAEPELLMLRLPKRTPLQSVPQVLVLNDCGIDQAGAAEDLKKKCNTVKELDLAQNKLENWNEIFSILTQMPKIEFVNLSLNRLETPIIAPPPCSMTNLRSLVLNNTKLNWFNVEELLKLLPCLEELHLSLNEYTHVLLDTIEDDDDQEFVNCKPSDECNCDDETPSSLGSNEGSTCCNAYRKTTNAHDGVKKLHLNGNPITDWFEICRLGRVFPQLEALFLAECPLRSISPLPSPPIEEEIETNDNQTPHEHFKNLQLLNLSSANINSWTDIDRLSKFPALKNLRVQNWPLWSKCNSTEQERRQFVIARLPQIEVLNGGGPIGSEEREDAERAFIRYYMERPENERPSRFDELQAKHGRLDPLVKIDLRPEKKVQIKFTFKDRNEVRYVNIYRTVSDLKLRLEKLFGHPANKMRLFYIDRSYEELMEPKEMRYPSKQLYTFKIATGDEIIIEPKDCPKSPEKMEAT
ncbi:CLUMA_CG012161, isoform A [Clunio marinus]|uniref:CLUMA_CG012161, isoform A n=1 Tax=Clunio marinus TaxID=568069 RepID=A0A1J1IFV5_9DIPT|nr:CLUMA_CG012161, isoform A [Clunio marinus]